MHKVKDVLSGRKVVLVFLSLYLPGYKGGGPTRTIFNMIESLGSEFYFKIITSDRDLGDKNPYESVKINQWTSMELYDIYYFSKNNSILKMIDLIRNTEYDMIYINSLFSVDFTLKPLLLDRFGFIEKKPILLAPRGELAQSALAIKKNKKEIFLAIANRIKLYERVHWHASSEVEKNDILNNFTKYVKIKDIAKKIHIATNLSVFNQNIFKEKNLISDNSTLRVCFLSRIVPIKNLDFALSVLSGITTDIHFCIYGPKESAEYWDKCSKIIESMPDNINITYGGAVKNEDVRKTISNYDLFFVPTKGENFGHVFAESLSVGVPILLSDQTPWRNLQEFGVGWDLPLDQPILFRQAIINYQSSSLVVKKQSIDSCLHFYERRCKSDVVVNENRDLFLRLMSDSS